MKFRYIGKENRENCINLYWNFLIKIFLDAFSWYYLYIYIEIRLD